MGRKYYLIHTVKLLGQLTGLLTAAFLTSETALQNGYHVKELRKSTPITYEDLKDYNVFIVPEANIPYKNLSRTLCYNM